VEYVFSKHHCQAEVSVIAVIASTTYMAIVELFDEWPAPSDPSMR